MSSTLTALFPDVNNNGLVDKFGNGSTTNAHANFFAIPAALAAQPQSSWHIAQWVQPVYINPNDYTVNNPATYDPLYGNALYSWAEPGTKAGIAIYRNAASAGGGYVYNLSDGNGVNEADMFLESPAPLNPANDSLNHPITFSMDAKLTQAMFQNTLADAQSHGAVAGNIDIGFDLHYNGAGGLPKYSGFAQIVPMTSNLVNRGTAAAAYKNFYTMPALKPGAGGATQFIYSSLQQGDPGLPILPSDANATPDLLTYNVNNYAYQAIYDAFKNFSSAAQSNLFNLANWSVTGMYVGLASDNQQGNSGVAGNVAITAQLSNIKITTDLTKTYHQNQPVKPVGGVDTNPQIRFYDSTRGIGGLVDGSETDTTPGIQNKYIYTGNANISLTAPAGANWLFGGGSGLTNLTALSGNNIFQASSGGSFMTGGSGLDSFLIPDANVTGMTALDTIVNFHTGDSVTLAGLGGAGWSYSWQDHWGQGGSSGLTLYANSSLHAGLSEILTFAGLHLSDLATLGVSQASGGLTFTRESAAAPAGSFTPASVGSAANTVGIQATDLNLGGQTMQFISPYAALTRFNNSSPWIPTSTLTGMNDFTAASGNSFMAGSAGNDSFSMPDANVTGIGFADVIANFHAGDVASLAGVGGAGWHYSWSNNSDMPGIAGLTLDAVSTVKPGLTEQVTFAGLSSASLASLMVTPNGSTGLLTITMSHS